MLARSAPLGPADQAAVVIAQPNAKADKPIIFWLILVTSSCAIVIHLSVVTV
ncbi:hypothetical protein CCP3SC1_60041 [Gammaproteobacteria bacterium]